MGIKAIIGYLNDRRIFTRDGGRWGIGQIHAILTRTTYVGEHRFNKRGKDKKHGCVWSGCAKRLKSARSTSKTHRCKSAWPIFGDYND